VIEEGGLPKVTKSKLQQLTAHSVGRRRWGESIKITNIEEGSSLFQSESDVIKGRLL